MTNQPTPDRESETSTRETPQEPLPVSAQSGLVGEGTENFYSGSEPFFTFFTQPQILLGTIRLTVDQRLVVPVTDLSAQMEAARRGFQHSGETTTAVQDITRISAQFRSRIQAWERELQNLQSDKRKLSGSLIHRIKAEAALIRGRIAAIDRAMVKLEVTLQQMAGEARGDQDRAPLPHATEQRTEGPVP